MAIQKNIAIHATIDMLIRKWTSYRVDIEKKRQYSNKYMQKQIKAPLFLNPKFLPIKLHLAQPAPKSA